jgi:hypothetical protein
MLPGLVLTFAILSAVPAQAPAQPDPVAAAVTRLEEALRTADKATLASLAADEAAVAGLVESIAEGPPSRSVVKVRDRSEIEGGHRLLIEVFGEYRGEGRLSAWNIDFDKASSGVRIISSTRLASVNGLFRLSLSVTRQYDIRNLTVTGPDLALHIAHGTAFVAETLDGPTAVVLLGAGEMRFSPQDPAERTQVRIFSGSDAMKTPFSAAFLRIRPADFATSFPEATLVERAASQRDLQRARQVFDEYVGKTLQIDLRDLSSERWWITPQSGDLIAEIRTKRFGSLTYARSGGDAEDISLFDRRRRRNIAVYASAEKLARRGRFYSEDDLVDYDVLAYDVDTTVSPDRATIEGNARIKLKIRSAFATTVNLRLAESLTVRGVFSPAFGRLLHLRVIGQNSLIVNLPGTATSGTEFWLNVVYGGRVQPQELDREAIATAQEPQEPTAIPNEPRFLYSHRAYWYPQSIVSDYAPVRLSITAPAGFDIVATGVSAGVPLPQAGIVDGGQGRRVFLFESERPVRYLAFVASRLRAVESRKVDGVSVSLLANPRQTARARGMADRAEDIFSFYRSLVGSAPYPALSVVFTERDAPGGHSPAYFVVVDQVPLGSSVSWRNDPVSFDTYPAFFLAHEIAHQWWGQAVGWKNYHEQWISEGFAQYFATLYAEKKLGPSVAGSVLRQMRQTAIAESSQGPIYLGYRLGHIKSDARVFRSIVYNKSAMVLHMLRRFIGEEAFFKGVAEFYDASQFRKAGTGDFISAMEKASGKPLNRFFDTWVFGESIPRVRFSYKVESKEAIVRLEQEGAPADFPITVTLTYASGERTHFNLLMTDKRLEQRLPLTGVLRSAAANADNASLAIVIR